MKKFFVFAAVAMMAMVSCGKDDNGGSNEPEVPEVKTAKENLVAHFNFESAEKSVALAEGITYASKAGAAAFAKGYIGNGYANTSAQNQEAYLKFNLAKSNALSSLSDVTVTLWVNNIEDFQKGGLFSVNGKQFPTQDWPSMIVYFDNKGVNNETQLPEQQINGRMMFKDESGNETNLWLDTWNPAFAKYGTWFHFAFTYQASTGLWALYVDGVKIREGEYGAKIPFGKCIPSDATALYLGGWASFIEKYAGAADWQTYFAGSLDELRIFNRVLTEAEIQALRKEEVAIALS